MISPLHFYVKHDFLLFSVNVKLFVEFFVMREKANYFYVNLFSEEVLGTLLQLPVNFTSSGFTKLF